MRRFTTRFCCGITMAAGLLAATGAAGKEPEMNSPVPENVYAGDLARFPGPWSFQLGKTAIILVSDAEFEALADPDQVLDLSMGLDKTERSLRQVCEEARARGARTLVLAFDHFFAQYRPGQDSPRTLTPDMDAYVERLLPIARFAEGYGLGLELSLLSPLEIGPAYQRATGESGVWMHYRKGLRDPRTGAFSVPLWRQHRWVNNKGPVEVEDAGVRVFAFKEERVPGASYRAVDPGSIVEITDAARVEEWQLPETGVARPIRVHGEGRTDIGPLDRVLVVQQYRTPEMDYFSPKALPFLKELVGKYADAGVRLNGLYSDEMHIQQDWAYHGHHDHGEFALRYVSPELARRFAAAYGAQYEDFARYLVYFTYGQEDAAPDLSAKDGVGHVFGPSPKAVRETALFRARYYRMLQNGVVDLFAQAKEYAEQRMGHALESRAHATWAESPTIDRWNTGRQSHAQNQYEYTSNFVWSCTVHQAASACYDYFKWGDFLTGNGNDHAEGGWLDRDYFGLALACSTGVVNRVPYSYAAHWGMPHELSRRRMALVNVYGAAGSALFGLVQDMAHRDVDVLMLYPLDLVAVEERFGSWMTQYGYANYLTQEKLLELGTVADGTVEVCGRRYTTLATTFEPFPSRRLLGLMQRLAETGGRVVWSGPPPVLTWEGEDALPAWQALFGVEYAPGAEEGLRVPGQQVLFEGALAGVGPNVILTDFLVDRIYPVAPGKGVEPVARVQQHVVGTRRAVGEGNATFLGYRPRDDQSQSLGYETRNWFETLNALGAYPPSGRFPGVDDNTEYVSRTSPWLACRFPNGSVALAPHFRATEENWGGGFSRDPKQDQAYLDQFPPPSEAIDLKAFAVSGHTVTYAGMGAVAFRLDDRGNLVAFAGGGSTRIEVDGREFVYADAPFGQLAWAPVPEARRVERGAVLQAMAQGTGRVRIPAAGLPAGVELVVEGPTPASRGAIVPSSREDGALVFDVTPEISGRWLCAVPAPPGP